MSVYYPPLVVILTYLVTYNAVGVLTGNVSGSIATGVAMALLAILLWVYSPLPDSNDPRFEHDAGWGW